MPRSNLTPLPRAPRERMSALKRILIVDDEADLRKIVLRILQENYDVQSAASGEEALVLLRKQRWHLLILDIGLAGIGGLHILRVVRKVYPELRVLMLTGAVDLSIVKKALDDGAHSYMTKPFACEELENTVRLLLSSEGPGDAGRPWRVAS